MPEFLIPVVTQFPLVALLVWVFQTWRVQDIAERKEQRAATADREARFLTSLKEIEDRREEGSVAQSEALREVAVATTGMAAAVASLERVFGGLRGGRGVELG